MRKEKSGRERGKRPGSQDGQALRNCGRSIRGFFDNMSHEWTVKFVGHRVADRRVLRLIRKWLRAGVSEEGNAQASRKILAILDIVPDSFCAFGSGVWCKPGGYALLPGFGGAGAAPDGEIICATARILAQVPGAIYRSALGFAWWYFSSMKVKTSVTLPGTLLEEIDRINPNRSAFLEQAARMYLSAMARRLRDSRDAVILDRNAERLNGEAADVLGLPGFSRINAPRRTLPFPEAGADRSAHTTCVRGR